MFTLPFRKASWRRNDLDQKVITSSLQETKQAAAINEEIEQVRQLDHHAPVEQPYGTISGQVEAITKKPLPSPQQEDAVREKSPAYFSYLTGVLDTPSPQQEDAVVEKPPAYYSYLDDVLDTPSTPQAGSVMEKPPAYCSYLTGVLDTPSPPPPPPPPPPHIRPIKHPYIRSWGCRRKERKRVDPFTAPGNPPLSPPTTPPTRSIPSDTDDMPRLSLKRARSVDSYDDEARTRRCRETNLRRTVSQPNSPNVMHLRCVWHHKRVYRVDPEEDGKAFEYMESRGCVWVEVEDEVLIVGLRKKILVWDEMIRRKWGFNKRCAIVADSD
ncbi:hypothetical protein EG328_010248 [Venturia inaequalis]|uniref:Uncharacterized protein n=1 Tax=Venturia inaequalis TaxID=5025 RepID=A0A8H3VA18_VENIN|nr:hypothetical protein EG328_010248 [Venturia inaequalis]